MTSKTVTGSDTTVNISSYSSGLYIVRAIHDGNIYSAKFIK
ncbi:T9SS type A sorting domain-containing protein [Prevotella sp. tf2-5]